MALRLHLANGRRGWVPFGDIAMTFWPESDVLVNGEQTTSDFSSLPSFSLGGGLAFHLSEAWALEANVKSGQSLFKDVPVGNITDAGKRDRVHTFLDVDAESARAWVFRGARRPITSPL